MAEPAQIFDDVAFYFFAVVMMGLILLPITLYKIKHCCTMKLINYQRSNKRLHPTVESIPNYIPKEKLITNHRQTSQYLSLKNIFFAFSWVLFLLLLIQLPRWNNSKLIEFDPWDILQIAKGSDFDAIKKAYRVMAKQYHPDLCTKPPLSWPERKCRDMFILVQKASDLLKDDPNWDGGSDPDHTKGGIVMMIGLPTWLLDHPLPVLLIYFGALIVLVCVVTFWWKHSTQYHRSGVKKKSIEIFWRFIKPNMMRLRTLLEILAASDEYRILDVFIPNDVKHTKYKDFLALEEQIISLRNNRQMPMENMFEISYVKKCCTLLTAHLLGVQIPESLNYEYLYVLQKAPHLIDVMIDMTLSRERYWFQTLQLIHLKQAIFQGVWPKESLLKQLPHWTAAIDRGIKKNGFINILQMKYLKSEQLDALLHKIYQRYCDNSYLMNENAGTLEYESGETGDDVEISQMVDDVASCIKMYPCVQMKYCARTYGEKTIHNKDIVTVTVHLERIQDPSMLNQARFKDVSEMKAPEMATETKDDCNEIDAEYARFEEDVSKKRKLQIDRIEGPIVHVNRFPFRVNEKWLVILIDEANRSVIDYKAVPDLRGLQKIDLHFAAHKQKSGRYPYALMAICDSYLGAEKIAKFKMYINNRPRDHIVPANDGEQSEPIWDEEEKQPEVKWYYLWNANFWEFLVTLFLLYFIYLVVIQSSFGKKYLEPLINIAFDGFIGPVWNLIVKNIDEFIVNPITKQLLKETGFNFIKWWNGIEDTEMSDDEYFEYAQREYDAMNDE